MMSSLAKSRAVLWIDKTQDLYDITTFPHNPGVISYQGNFITFFEHNTEVNLHLNLHLT